MAGSVVRCCCNGPCLECYDFPDNLLVEVSNLPLDSGCWCGNCGTGESSIRVLYNGCDPNQLYTLPHTGGSQNTWAYAMTGIYMPNETRYWQFRPNCPGTPVVTLNDYIWLEAWLCMRATGIWAYVCLHNGSGASTWNTPHQWGYYSPIPGTPTDFDATLQMCFPNFCEYPYPHLFAAVRIRPAPP